MSQHFVIYHIDSTLLVTGRNGKKSFETERAAKAGLTRFLKKNKDKSCDDYAIADSHTFYNYIEKHKVVKNLISGEEVTIAVNTPRYCDPSSEAYWSA